MRIFFARFSKPRFSFRSFSDGKEIVNPSNVILSVGDIFASHVLSGHFVKNRCDDNSCLPIPRDELEVMVDFEMEFDFGGGLNNLGSIHKSVAISECLNAERAEPTNSGALCQTIKGGVPGGVPLTLLEYRNVRCLDQLMHMCK